MKEMSALFGPWIIVTILCLIAIAILLPRGYYDAAFVAGTLGIVAGFLNYRSKIKRTIVEDAGTVDDDEDGAVEDEDEE